MYTADQIVNLSLSHIASSRIGTMSPARTELERYFALNYPAWKRQELTRRRWVFALVSDYTLTLTETLTDVEKPYKYAIPVQCLRPIRTKETTWVQRGRFLYSEYDTLKIDFVEDVLEANFDPLFEDVLTRAIAKNCCEKVTGSSSKVAEQEAKYKEAVRDAGQVNAFIIGPEDIQSDDSDFSWLGARYDSQIR